jgi:hypothetical protein
MRVLRCAVEVIAANPGRGRLTDPSQGAPLPKTVDGDGAIHLCEHVACKLPPERWWEGGKGSGSKGGNNRQINRR